MATLQSKLHIPESVYFQLVTDEAVILDTASGKYFGLDDVGTRMWQLLTEHGQIEPAYQALLQEYEVEAERLKADLLGLVDQLAAKGLILVDENPAE